MQTRIVAAAAGLVLAVWSVTPALGFRGDFPPSPPVSGCNVAADPTCTSPVRDPAPVNPPPPVVTPPTCDPFYGRHC